VTPLGWTIMLISISAVLALNAFCLYRVLMLPPANVQHLDTAPLDIDTRDRSNAD
jgi:hypothetical protein